jgi:hypothetical protein
MYGKADYLSQARFAHTYDLAISSSPFKEVATTRDCERSAVASSTNSVGRSPLKLGTRDRRAGEMALSMTSLTSCGAKKFYKRNVY